MATKRKPPTPRTDFKGPSGAPLQHLPPRVHQASLWAPTRTLCGLMLGPISLRVAARLSPGDVTCKTCLQHRGAEARVSVAKDGPVIAPEHGAAGAAVNRLERRAELGERGWALYRRAVEHVAHNDDPSELELMPIARSLSVALIADVFEVRRTTVARDVLKCRKRAL